MSTYAEPMNRHGYVCLNCGDYERSIQGGSLCRKGCGPRLIMEEKLALCVALRVQELLEKINSLDPKAVTSTEISPDRPAEELETKIPPTLEAVRLLAAKVGLPDVEAEKLWNFYESKGWMVGKSKMKSLGGAIGGWAARWRQTQFREQQAVLSGAEIVLRGNELETVKQKMKSISNSYGEHQSWSDADIAKFRVLKTRKAELMRLLGLQA